MPSSRDSFRRNRVAPVGTYILARFAQTCGIRRTPAVMYVHILRRSSKAQGSSTYRCVAVRTFPNHQTRLSQILINLAIGLDQ
jgi:hypothetical protein